jgi:hypothetical protein
VILIDANILVYAFVETTSQHEVARHWLDRQLNGTSRVGLPWGSLLAFLRVTTSPRVYPRPAPMRVAMGQASTWVACDTVWIPQPTERHMEVLAILLAQPGLYGNLVQDAHLAALAIEHGLTLYSADNDFARFPGLRWANPLSHSD